MKTILPFLLFALLSASKADLDTSTCGKSKGCWFAPVGCEKTDSCDNVISFARKPDGFVEFEMKSSKVGSKINYLSLGFSEDNEMGSEAVTHCAFLDKPEVHVTYNFGKSNSPLGEVNEQQAESSNVELVEATRSGDSLYCRFKQRIAPTIESQYFPRLNTSYVLLFARGKTRSPKALAPHSFDTRNADFPSVSGLKLNLDEEFDTPKTEVNDVKQMMNDEPMAEPSMSPQTRRNLVVAHGIMMIIAWMVCVAIAVFSARYLRHHWPQKTPLGLKIWFHLHRTLNVFAVIVMILSLLLIFIAKDWTWKGPWFTHSWDENFSGGALHSFFGAVALILGISQPFNSLLRCGPDHRTRPIFNWSHRTIGLIAFVNALIAIFISTLKFTSLWTDSGWALALVIFYGVCGILLVAASEYANCLERRQVSSISMEMKSNQQRRGEQVNVITRGRTSDKHKHILTALLAIVAGLAIAIATILIVLCAAS